MLIRTLCAFDLKRLPHLLGIPGQGLYFIREALASLFNDDETIADLPVLYFCLPYQLPEPSPEPRFLAFAWPFSEFPPRCASAPLDDWRRGLASCLGALVFSQQAAKAVRDIMGDDYPVLVIPAHLAERFAGLCPEDGVSPDGRPRVITFNGHMLDSPRIGLSVDGLAAPPPPPPPPPSVPVRRFGPRARLKLTWQMWCSWWQEAVVSYGSVPQIAESPVSSPVEDIQQPAQRLKLYGTVYTCILRAEDEQCRWMDLLSAFCITFRDKPNATLVLKFTHHDPTAGRIALLTTLSRLSPFRCRVVAINAYLDDAEYSELIQASHYLVQPSQAEASALTAQEFLSAGRPVIGPAYGALAEWLTQDNAFLVSGSQQPTHWLGDVDKQLHHSALRLNWKSLCEALEQSYEITQKAPSDYRAKSLAARNSMSRRTSSAQVAATLYDFFGQALARDKRIDLPQEVS